jgi:hypothetical protein
MDIGLCLRLTTGTTTLALCIGKAQNKDWLA